MKSEIMKGVWLLALLAGLPASLHGASLLLYADSTNGLNVPNVISTINGTGVLPDPVDSFDGESTVPTLAQLQAYESVLVWSNDSFNDPDGIGNVLAQYVDAGGGVVVATFGNATGEIGGTFASGGYHPITPGAASNGPANLTLGNTPDPGHALLAGVVTFDGGNQSFRGSGSAAPGTTVVAEWSNGDPLIVESAIFNAPVIGVNFFPPSSLAEANSWDSTTDGGRILANSLAHAAGRSTSTPEPSTTVFLLLAAGGFICRRKRVS